jgi:hypothetical protein
MLYLFDNDRAVVINFSPPYRAPGHATSGLVALPKNQKSISDYIAWKLPTGIGVKATPRLPESPVWGNFHARL